MSESVSESQKSYGSVRSHTVQNFPNIFTIGTSVWRSSGCCLGGVVRAVDCWQMTKWPLFSSVFSFFPPFFLFPPSRPFLIEAVLGSKNLFCESCLECPQTRTPRPFWIKWAVRCCRRCGFAGGEPVPPAPLGWYFSSIFGLWVLSRLDSGPRGGSNL